VDYSLSKSFSTVDDLEGSDKKRKHSNTFLLEFNHLKHDLVCDFQ
jgi:hypothetical protein